MKIWSYTFIQCCAYLDSTRFLPSKYGQPYARSLQNIYNNYVNKVSVFFYLNELHHNHDYR